MLATNAVTRAVQQIPGRIPIETRERIYRMLLIGSDIYSIFFHLWHFPESFLKNLDRRVLSCLIFRKSVSHRSALESPDRGAQIDGQTSNSGADQIWSQLKCQTFLIVVLVYQALHRSWRKYAGNWLGMNFFSSFQNFTKNSKFTKGCAKNRDCASTVVARWKKEPNWFFSVPWFWFEL